MPSVQRCRRPRIGRARRVWSGRTARRRTAWPGRRRRPDAGHDPQRDDPVTGGDVLQLLGQHHLQWRLGRHPHAQAGQGQADDPATWDALGRSASASDARVWLSDRLILDDIFLPPMALAAGSGAWTDDDASGHIGGLSARRLPDAAEPGPALRPAPRRRPGGQRNSWLPGTVLQILDEHVLPPHPAVRRWLLRGGRAGADLWSSSNVALLGLVLALGALARAHGWRTPSGTVARGGAGPGLLVAFGPVLAAATWCSTGSRRRPAWKASVPAHPPSLLTGIGIFGLLGLMISMLLAQSRTDGARDDRRLAVRLHHVRARVERHRRLRHGAGSPGLRCADFVVVLCSGLSGG